MLTKEEYANTISKLISGEITDEISEILDTLKEDRQEIENKISKNSDEWEKKYNDLHDKYISRFFTDEKIIEKNDNDTIIDDSETKSIDEIIKED